MKKLNKSQLTNEDLEHQRNEASILRVCDSPYVVKMYDLFEDCRHVYIVQEYVEGVSLLKILKNE